MAVHELAVVHPGAQVHPGAIIHPFTTIGEHVVVGRGCEIEPRTSPAVRRWARPSVSSFASVGESRRQVCGRARHRRDRRTHDDSGERHHHDRNSARDHEDRSRSGLPDHELLITSDTTALLATGDHGERRPARRSCGGRGPRHPRSAQRRASVLPNRNPRHARWGR